MKNLLNQIFSFFKRKKTGSIEDINKYFPELPGPEADRLSKAGISFGTGKQRSTQFYKESFPGLSDADAEAIRSKLND